MLEIKNLKKSYGKLVAVDNVSLKVNKGEIFALLGFNAAGKTTLIKCACSLLTQDEGEILYNGKNLKEYKTEIKSFIGVSPQESAFAKNLKVIENFVLISQLYGLEKSKAKEISTKLIDLIGLKSKANTLASKLSGGQKRRLSLGLALVNNPQVLFLDEPTLGLDISARNKLWELIKSFKGEKTIILTTHYLEEITALADRIGIMKKGKLVAVGTLEEILNLTKKNTLEEAFLYLAGDENE